MLTNSCVLHTLPYTKCCSGNNVSLKLSGGAPAPTDCELYSVDRDALFSYHKLSEAFLQKLMGLYTSAHYKNSPNDLQMLSDAPAHSVFCLLSPSAEKDADCLPDILAVVQVALEGKVSRKSVEAQLARGHRSAGDMIPWTVSQQFGDSKFAGLSGARVVRIATHPSLQGMGYGSRAVELLYRFYNGEMVNLGGGDDDEDDENEDDDDEDDEDDDDEGGEVLKVKGIQGERLAPRKELPPLLLPLTEVEAPRLDWLGTSFGLTEDLHRFWTRAGMRLLYLRQTSNELTGEHSAIMVRALPRRTGVDDAWLPAFVGDTKRRILSLLSGPFRHVNVRLAMAVLENLDSVPASTETSSALHTRTGAPTAKIEVDELNYFLTPHDLKRLELYGRNLCDHHLVTDLIPSIARLYFTSRFGSEFSLSSVQAALLCGIGVQNREVDSLTSELGLPLNQVLAMFNKAVRKISIALNTTVEEHEKRNMLGGEKRRKVEAAAEKMRDVAPQTLEDDVAEAATAAMTTLTSAAREQQEQLPRRLANDDDVMQYAIKGSEQEWSDALRDRSVLENEGGAVVSIKSVRATKRKLEEKDIEQEGQANPNKTKGTEKHNKKDKKKRGRK